MPTYKCTKCKRQIFDIITTNEEKKNTVNLIFSRLTNKFAYFYDIKPEVKHYEIQNKDNCDGLIKLSLFDKTPENFRSINFISFLKSKDIDGLKKEIILKIIQDNKTPNETNNKLYVINNNNNDSVNKNNVCNSYANINENKVYKRNNIFNIFLYYFYIFYLLLKCIINSLRKYT